MAIKVNGTTVIDDSRNLVNIASGAGSSTTAGDVGTYIIGRPANSTAYSPGSTASGLYAAGPNYKYQLPFWNSTFYNSASTAVSGTWRCMSHAANNGSDGMFGLWVRIS